VGKRIMKTTKEVDIQVKQATHIPILVKTFELTKGDVLELGSGYFSTSILRWLCQMHRRTLYSYESSNFWYQKVIKAPVPFHKVIKVSDWNEAKIEKHWEMVLIDHSPDERRWVDIKRLANLAEYIVIHDSNFSAVKHYGYERIWGLFKYRYDYTKLNPNTAVVSNFHNLKGFT
jgi:hypothetical protein